MEFEHLNFGQNLYANDLFQSFIFHLVNCKGNIQSNTFYWKENKAKVMLLWVHLGNSVQNSRTWWESTHKVGINGLLENTILVFNISTWAFLSDWGDDWRLREEIWAEQDFSRVVLVAVLAVVCSAWNKLKVLVRCRRLDDLFFYGLRVPI